MTAKLSRRFYEQFGDDLTNELVEWFNQVDATYRTEFRELFEVHFARIDAKFGELRGELRGEFREEIGGMRQDPARGLADLRTEIAASRAESLRWNFLFWIGTVGTVAALMKL